MARQASAGELKTRITIQRPAGIQTPNGYMTDAWETAGTHYCKWVNAYGRDVFDARQAGLTEFATLTLRYTGKITPTCRVLRGDDPKPYDVVSVNNVEDRRTWLEVKVWRKVASV